MRAFASGLLVVLLAVGSAHARDPWKEKPPAEWTLEEVRQVLAESPWVRNVLVPAPWMKGDAQYLQSLPPNCTGRPDMDRDMKPPAGIVAGMTQSVVVYKITWQNARSVRGARIRLAVLCKQVEPDDAEEEMQREFDEYVITMQSPDMRPFDGMDEETLQKNTYLMPKSTKQRIQPSRVMIRHGADRQTVFSLAFIFPKATDAGEPVLPKDEKEIEFGTQAGKTMIKAKFQPPKMIDTKGSDL